MPLLPEASAYLEKVRGAPEPQEAGVEAFRTLLPVPQPAPDNPQVTVATFEIPRSAGAPLSLRVYRPAGEVRRPAIVWVHGGSFTRGSLAHFDSGRRVFALASDCVIVAVGQRLAPEFRFPAPLEDAALAIGWTRENAATIGVDPDHIGVGGESSGANVAAALCLRLREDGPMPRFQVLLAPLTDARCESASMTAMATGYGLTRAQLLWAYEQYAPGVDRSTPLLSPLCAGDLSGLPPAVVVTIEYDPVRDEGTAYAARLAEAGVAVFSGQAAGGVHHYPGPAFGGLAMKLTRELLRTTVIS